LASIAHLVTIAELIRQGLARVLTRYCYWAICQEWQVLEAEAREKKRGLWCMPSAIPRWEFRKRKR
jgi:micrococcal nuclease